MDWSAIAGTLSTMGLTALGTAVGGPAGGVFGKAIADALGVSPTPEAVQQAIASSDPETIKAQLADIDSARQADVQLHRQEAESSANARAMQIVAMEHNSMQESTPMVLAYLNFGLVAVVVLCLIMMPLFSSVELPSSLRELLTLILGVLLASFKDSQGFFFGTSRSSERNGAAMRTIAAAANTPSPAQLAGQAIGAAVGKVVAR